MKERFMKARKTGSLQAWPRGKRGFERREEKFMKKSL